MNYDYSTINLKKLEKLPVYELPKNYILQKDPGNCCFLDPPGYPTYFTQHVYNSHGDSPGNNTIMIIKHPETGNYHVVEREVHDWRKTDNWNTYKARIDARLKSLYIPLPIDHPRVVEWIVNMFTHFKHCYFHPTQTEYNSKKIVIFPVPKYELFGVDNKDLLISERESIAINDNHCGVVNIRNTYPEFIPTMEQIKGDLPKYGDWYERLAIKPTPDNCPGKYGRKHPFNGNWCQFCGWSDK